VLSRLTTFLSFCFAALVCACHAPSKPSDQLRHDSFIHSHQLFSGNTDAAKRLTYIIFAAGPQFRASIDPHTGEIQWFSGGKGFSSGLAVGVASDGYLITAAHNLDVTNFVFGLFDGKMDVKPARVIFKRGSGTHADFALIKTEGKLDCCAPPAVEPNTDDPVFAVVCYRKDTQLTLDFAGGKILGISADPQGGGFDLIHTDIPLDHGDSGGPLLSISGQLVGINSGISYNWRKHWSDSFFPDGRSIQDLIQRDRLVREADEPIESSPRR
jgi:hypothetical protein